MLKTYPRQDLSIWWNSSKRHLPNNAILNDLPDELHTIEADDKIPNNCKCLLATIQTAQNQRQTNTGGLANFLKLKIGAKAVLKVSLYIQNLLINGQAGNVSLIEFALGSVTKVFWWTNLLKGNEIILSGHKNLLGSYWKMWSWDSTKERISISIY